MPLTVHLQLAHIRHYGRSATAPTQLRWVSSPVTFVENQVVDSGRHHRNGIARMAGGLVRPRTFVHPRPSGRDVSRG